MRIIVHILLAVLVLSLTVSDVNTLKILAVNPYQGKSHYFALEPLLLELARRGHEVTSISYFPQKKSVKNFTDISLAGSVKVLEDVFPIENSYVTVINLAIFLVTSGTDNCKVLLQNKEVQNLWKSKVKFDIVLVEQFNSDCSLGLAYKLGSPVIGLTTHVPIMWHYDRFGIPSNPAYISFLLFGGGTKPTLYQRLEAFVFKAYYNTLYTWYAQRIDQNTLAEYFDGVPPLEELGREIKMLLTYKNPVLFGPSLIPENVKEVGGYHVAAPKPLSGILRLPPLSPSPAAVHAANTMRIILKVLLICLVCSLTISDVTSLKILAVNPYQGKSHYFVFQPLLLELAKRGHDVTSISYFPQKQPVKNFTDISLAGSVKILEDVFPIEKSYMTVISICKFLVTSGTENCRVLLENKEVQNLWESKTKFDVVLVEQFQSDCALGLAYKLGAPVMGLTSHTPMTWHYDRFGMPSNPSYVPSLYFGGGAKPTLYQRIEAFVFNAYFNTVYKWYAQRTDQKTLAKYFEDVPPLEELGKEMKFYLTYKHPLLFGSSIIPENVKEVGGYHVATPKPLSGELKKFIDEAEHGVLYISFGSMLRASSTPRDKLEAIISAVSELPQRVVFKWEEPNLPGNPKNIYVSDWLPQNDILAHPKVIAFYSHCGLLGTTEAIHHGVPMLGMPIFGDQPSNAAAVEESGLGVRIDVTTLTKQKLLNQLKIILDPEFRRKVKLLSKAWHDRPMSAMDTAIYWIEYAVRNKNINFRSPAADLPLYKYFNLDVLAIFGLIVYSIFFVIKSLFSLRKTQPNKQSKNKKSKTA